ncbi:hypothetical protein ACG33_09925 [Steroidobacter denitrificans]|uniref:Rad50/SbcC-type AAA domain-containing protein n=1 Tax=Steroidobacter denitrificans TaxID=465721 RepID=A0A127FCV8_STEDE|nr:AAA family ATPase [Steroidobacter denitrificans]AMN47409.1 hypothetical protein ACG33_09925 [Steroidobacter denitrificans]
MKLTRIRIEQFKQFRQALEIDGLAPGLNIFTGPNEAGKSTIAAAIRAAFFERHRSGSVGDLRPWGDSSASPKITLEFQTRKQHYRLTKSFLGSRRCELEAGTLRLDGAEAEDHLASLLRYEHAGKGASKAEHWGIPGLLWIEQGRTQELREAVAYAADHLSAALNESLGEIAGTGGDEVLATIEAQRNELLTPSSGAARGAYAEARRHETALAGQIRTLTERIDVYRHNVDTFASMRQAHASDEAGKPWESLRKRQHEAEESLKAITGMQQALNTDRQRAAELDERLGLLRAQLEAFDNEVQDLTRRREARDAAMQLQASAAEQVRQWQEKNAQALLRDTRARAAARLARQEHARHALNREAREARAKVAELAAMLAKADAQLASRLALQAQAAASEISSQDLERLRRQADRRRELRIQQQAAATRMHFVLAQDCVIHLGEEILSGEGERLLIEPASLALPGLGTLQITPGGMDLAQLEREAARCEEQHAALLRHLAVDSLEAAQERHDQYRQLGADIKSADMTLKALAPQGIDELRARLLKHQARAADIDTALGKLPPAPAMIAGAAPGIISGAISGAPSEAPIPGVEDAEAEEEASRHALEQFAQALNQAQLAAAGAHHVLESAQHELARAQALFEAPQRADRIREVNQQLTDTRAERSALDERIHQRTLAIEQARPQILEQDVDRYRRSAEQQEKQFRERREALLRLEVELQSAGALGLEEHRAELERDHTQALRRVEELQQRAAALDYLLILLREKRSTLTRRLRAPLQKHLDHYLQLLFPQAHVQIDENLSPGMLTHTDGQGTGGGDFESLSFGAREQIGLISRLAYADLLKEAGNPTLIILDDVLVHSDEARLVRMKRILFDAATRHQILLFTCHPERWRDMGVTARDLDMLRRQT